MFTEIRIFLGISHKIVVLLAAAFLILIGLNQFLLFCRQ